MIIDEIAIEDLKVYDALRAIETLIDYYKTARNDMTLTNLAELIKTDIKTDYRLKEKQLKIRLQIAEERKNGK